jgi:alpha-N-arabinofuranosidase
VGNESWGCGGNFTPEDYASEFRRFTTWVPTYEVNLQFIGSGPNGNDIDWTHRFFEKLYSGHAYDNARFSGWSVHHYAWNLSQGKSEDWLAAKGEALRFEPVIQEEWAKERLPAGWIADLMLLPRLGCQCFTCRDVLQQLRWQAR